MSENNICYNFMVSNNHHLGRTIPLTEIVGKDILDSGDQYYLLGSVDAPNFPRLLKLSECDTYYSLTDKMFKSFEYHHIMRTQFDWYFIGADDTFVNVKRLNELINFIKINIHNSTDLFIVGATRHPNGSEIPVDNGVTVKGGSGILMNRYTFNTIRDFCHKHNYEIKDANLVQDATMDLIIRTYNALHLYDENKQILYFNSYNMVGDTDSLKDEEVWKYATIHNHAYWTPSRTLTNLKEHSVINADSPLFVRYCHFRSPSRDFYFKGPK